MMRGHPGFALRAEMHEESRRFALLANPLQHRLERFALLRLQLYFPPGYGLRLQGKPQRADRGGVGFDYPQVCRAAWSAATVKVSIL